MTMKGFEKEGLFGKMDIMNSSSHGLDWTGINWFLQITSWSVWWSWTSTPAWTSTWLGCCAEQQGAGQGQGGQGGEGGGWGGGAQTWNTWLGRHSNTGTASFQASKPPAPYNPTGLLPFPAARPFFRNLFFFPKFLQPVLFPSCCTCLLHFYF